MSEKNIVRFQFAPNLRERYKGQTVSLMREQLGENPIYYYVRGDYGKRGIVDFSENQKDPDRLRENFEDLMGLEKFLKRKNRSFIDLKG